MTFSLVVHDPSHDAYAAAVKSSVPSIGAFTPHSSLNGAVCSQAFFNAEICYRTLQLLDIGVEIQAAMKLALEEDFSPSHRQVHGVGRGGQTFAHTGSDTVETHGHRTGRGYSVAGNHLANDEVVDAVADAWEGGADSDLVPRLIDALTAGEIAGGEWMEDDWPLKCSAAVIVASPTPHWNHNLRVDASDTPLEDLRDVYEATVAADDWAEDFFGDIAIVAPIHWYRSRAPRTRDGS